MKEKASVIAQKIIDTANRLGWKVTVRNSILTITKKFAAGNNDEFVQCDMEYYDILSLLPMTSPGSIYGSDGSGLGAISAINHGLFKMNKTGGSKLVLKELVKMGY